MTNANLFHSATVRLQRSAIATLMTMASCLLSAQPHNAVAISPRDTPQQIVDKAAAVVPSFRQLRWQQQELTAFVHFGINTFTDREWGDGTESPQRFNPRNLDADQWTHTLKETGFKSLILTCKHHDGFCLWPSAFTEHSVKNATWKGGQGDVVREVADACRKYGLSFGVYLSPWDRNSPLYGTDAYNDYFANQLTELLTLYGRVDEVWFDGACGEGPNGKKQTYDFTRWYKLIRTLQPQAVIAVMGPDVRWVGTEVGKGRETEWSVVPMDHLDPHTIAQESQQDMLVPPSHDMVDQDLGSREMIYKAKALAWYPAETDVSIRPGWFYHAAEDTLVKSPERLLDIYFTSVGMNSVLLLNIPPNPEGRFSEADVQSLKGFKQLRDSVFANNLLADTKRHSSRNGTHIYTLRHPSTFGILSLQEDISRGQHVEKFRLDVEKDNGQWLTVTRGTTIGYKRLLRFAPVKARRVRLVIEQTRATPHLLSVGLY